MTSDTVRATLSLAWNSLRSLGYDCALMGGVALSTWNHPRATRDIDLLVALDRREIDQLLSQLSHVGFRPKTNPPLNMVGDFGFVQLLYTPPGEFYDVQLDLMLAESALHKSAIQRRVPRHVPGIDVSIDVLSCEDLLLFKLISGRMIDRADSAILLRENWQTCDEAYFASWIERLSLSPEFDEVWREAFPGESLPI